MGINLWDIGSFATGAIERDRELTKEASSFSLLSFGCSCVTFDLSI